MITPIRKLVVVGGSAGSIPALCAILGGLPAESEAAVLVVVHTGEERNLLAQVFQRSTSLKVVVVNDAEHIKAGCVYLSSPNRHLMVRDGCALAVYGPRENRNRPAVDTLFRSTARAHHSHAIAVILSGALDDGTAGALAVKARGGTLIIQDPESAEQPNMPANAMRYTGVDYSLPASHIAPLLSKLISTGDAIPDQTSEGDCQKLLADLTFPENEPFAFSCPECGGALTESFENGLLQYRCHVGHGFSLDSFSEAEAEALERAVWMAYRKLKEHHAIQVRLAKFDHQNGKKSRFEEVAAAAAGDMKLLQGILSRL